MAACRIEDLSGYLALLRTRDDEFQELVEYLIVPESWFFRDLQPFRFLEHYVSEHWQPQHPNRALRLLSLPCGAGEEPFSMAMTLLNLGLDATRFHVDGVDISQRVLRDAEAGCYGELSFREREETVANYRDRFYHAAGPHLVVNPAVRSAVRFQQGNIAGPAFLSGKPRYDVIFCRNLLIYLDADARRTALANLHGLLEDEGVLYVGHVEAEAVRNGPFGPYVGAFPFAFRPVCGNSGKGRNDDGIDSTSRISHKPPLPQSSRRGDEGATSSTLRLAQEESKAASKMIPAAGDPQAEFEAARQSADRGFLEEATAQCLELLAKYPLRAEVFCLLGVVHQARGDGDQAETCFHKALYLDPQHYQALVHLELLARQRGEDSLALNFRRRAGKIQREGGR